MINQANLVNSFFDQFDSFGIRLKSLTCIERFSDELSKLGFQICRIGSGTFFTFFIKKGDRSKPLIAITDSGNWTRTSLFAAFDRQRHAIYNSDESTCLVVNDPLDSLTESNLEINPLKNLSSFWLP